MVCVDVEERCYGIRQYWVPLMQYLRLVIGCIESLPMSSDRSQSSFDHAMYNRASMQQTLPHQCVETHSLAKKLNQAPSFAGGSLQCTRVQHRPNRAQSVHQVAATAVISVHVRDILTRRVSAGSGFDLLVLGKCTRTL
jgi:hypothetical protein